VSARAGSMLARALSLPLARQARLRLAPTPGPSLEREGSEEERRLCIGILPNPTSARAWPDIAALLQPAADLADGIIALAGRQLWTAYDGRLLAAATTRTTLDGWAEVELVGGRDVRRWLKPLDATIAAWAADEGMTAIRAYGRAGWARLLGWDVLGIDDGSTVYERKLT